MKENLESFNPLWDLEYKIIRDYLMKNLGNKYEYYHVGSTSLENCEAMPIIDIDIVIPTINDLPEITKKLKKIGYISVGTVEEKDSYHYVYEENFFMNHNLNICIKNGREIQKHLLFRSHMMTHKEDVIRFSNLKKKMIGKEKSNYYLEKRKFVEDLLTKDGYTPLQFETKMPDYKNCALNVAASFQKYMGLENSYPTLPELDAFLNEKEYNTICYIVLDGLGMNIIKGNTKENSIFNIDLAKVLSAIYPSTTVAATTSITTGLSPIETGWIGWQQYFPGVDRNIEMFSNCDFYTGEKIPGNIAQDFLPVKPFYSKKSNYKVTRFMPSFGENGSYTFEEMINKMIHAGKKKKGKNFFHAYWDKPDSIIHEFGCYNDIVKENLGMLDFHLKRLYSELPYDSLIVITADHGLVDVSPIDLQKFTDITTCFAHNPALEPRCTAFYIKPEKSKQFERLFQNYFGAYFKLYTAIDFVQSGYLGDWKKANGLSTGFLGDYIAVAIDKYYFSFKGEVEQFSAAHAGLTRQEMEIPLIVLKK